jgi:hypothetical protein
VLFHHFGGNAHRIGAMTQRRGPIGTDWVQRPTDLVGSSTVTLLLAGGYSKIKERLLNWKKPSVPGAEG